MNAVPSNLPGRPGLPAWQPVLRKHLWRLSFIVLMFVTAAFPGWVVAADGDAMNGRATAEAEALAVMETFLKAFNASDVEAWADTLVFPHLRFASGTVTVYADRAEFVAAMDMAAFAANTGWRRSSWDHMQIVQSSPEKVHVRVRFSRFDAQDELIASYDSLYIIEAADGRWGVRARSSFAP